MKRTIEQPAIMSRGTTYKDERHCVSDDRTRCTGACPFGFILVCQHHSGKNQVHITHKCDDFYFLTLIFFYS